MKMLAQILGALLFATALGGLGLIAIVEFIRHCSPRPVMAVVGLLSPGTSFSVTMQRLGQLTQNFTNGAELVCWAEKMHSRVEANVAINSILHTFVHQGRPFRYVLVYTDQESQKVVFAEWCHM